MSLHDFDILTLDNCGRRVYWVSMGGEQVEHKIGSGQFKRLFFQSSFVHDSERKVHERAKRPYHKREGIFWELIDEIHDWIMDTGVPHYVIDYRWMDTGVEWAVGFPDTTTAVQYKLRWVE